MTKRPFGHGPFQWMGNFKAVAMDYEYYLTLGDEGQLYCLTDREVYVLMVQLTYVGWLTRWYNTDDITQTTVGYIQSELMEKLMSCVDIGVLMDQAALNLVDSTTAKQLESQRLRDELEERYDGDPTSINPNAPTTNFGSSGDRYDALCAGLTAFVYQFARSQADSVRAGQIGGLAAVALVAALLIPGLNFFFVVGASIAVLLGLGTIGVSTETAIQALTDREALDNVICYMTDQLKNDAVSEANWISCLDSYPFSVGSHAAIVADFLKATLADNYLTILNVLGQAYTGVINGDAMPECPCNDWEHCIDLVASDGDFEQLGTPSGNFGVWTPGVGWVAGHGVTPGPNSYRMVQVGRATSSFTITGMSLTGSVNNGTQVIPPGLPVVLGTNQGELLTQNFTLADGTHTVSADVTFTGVTQIFFRWQCGFIPGSAADPGGSATATQLCVRGTGFNPFI